MCFWLSIFVGTCALFEFRFLVFCEEKSTSYFTLKDCGIYYVPPRNLFSKYGLDKFVGFDPGVS